MIHTIAEPIKTAISGMTMFAAGTGTRIAGVVIPVTKTDKDGKKFTFPASCDVDGTACYEQGRYFDLLPNDKYRAVIYLEQRTDVRFVGYKPPKDKVMIYETDLRLIGWLNAKKLGSTDCSITSRIVLEIIKTLTTAQGEIDKTSGRLTVADSAFTNSVIDVLPVLQVRQDRSIFSRYNLKETNLLYPWDYFAIDLRCALYVGRECFDAPAFGVIDPCAYIAGEFPDDPEATVGGVLSNEMYNLSQDNYRGMPWGLVVVNNPNASYKNDDVASVADGQWYAVSIDNSFSVKPGAVRVKNYTGTAYSGDEAAEAGGVAIGGHYISSSEFELNEGWVLIRKE